MRLAVRPPPEIWRPGVKNLISRAILALVVQMSRTSDPRKGMKRGKVMSPNTVTPLGLAVSGYVRSDGYSTQSSSYNISETKALISCTSKNGNYKLPNPHFYEVYHSFNGRNARLDLGAHQGATYRSYGYGVSDGAVVNTERKALFPYVSETLNDRAMAKIFEQIRGQGNLAVDVAEGGQTIRMLRNALSVKKLAAEFMRDIVRHKKYRKIKGPNQSQRRLDYVTKKWLEYRYGWLPFVSSTYELMEELHKQRFGGLKLVHARESMTRRKDEEVKIPGGSELRSVEEKHSVSYGLLFQLDDGSSIYDFTTLSPARFAWELTTLSSVADWFANVGRTLELWENVNIFSKHFRGGYRTGIIISKRFGVSSEQWSRPWEYWPGTNPAIPIDGNYYHDKSAQGHSKYVIMSRTLVPTLPTPAGFRLETRLNAKRMLDAAALIKQIFVRR